jgi:hypothetical protein
MIPLKPVERDLRRARLIAARTRPVAGINRKGILRGDWDNGSIVRQYRGGQGAWVGAAQYPQILGPLSEVVNRD